MTPLVGLSTVNIYQVQVHRAVDLKVETDRLALLTSQYLIFHQEVLLKQPPNQLVVPQEAVAEKEGCTNLQYQLDQETTAMEGHVIERRRKRECKRELMTIFSQLKRRAREDRYVNNNVCGYVCNSSSFSSVLHERYSLHGYKPGHDHTDRTIDIYCYDELLTYSACNICLKVYPSLFYIQMSIL